MSLFVAVTLVPVLCSRLLVLPPPPRPAQAASAESCTRFSERLLEGMDDGYRRLLHLALAHRPMVVGLAAASVVAAALIFPTLPTEFATQADEGQVQVSVELAQGTRIEVTDPVLQRIEAAINRARAGSDRRDRQRRRRRRPGGGGPGGGGSVNRGQLQLLLKPKDERTRSSDQIAQDLRRQLVRHSRA